MPVLVLCILACAWMPGVVKVKAGAPAWFSSLSHLGPLMHSHWHPENVLLKSRLGTQLYICLPLFQGGRAKVIYLIWWIVIVACISDVYHRAVSGTDLDDTVEVLHVAIELRLKQTIQWLMEKKQGSIYHTFDGPIIVMDCDTSNTFTATFVNCMHNVNQSLSI